jgi:hypothetical protein
MRPARPNISNSSDPRGKEGNAAACLRRPASRPHRDSRQEGGQFRALGLPFIEPELREERDEIERALNGTLPELVTDEDVRGILHSRADASDGTESLESVATSPLERGFEYFGVADHSKSAFRFRPGASADGSRWAGRRAGIRPRSISAAW